MLWTLSLVVGVFVGSVCTLRHSMPFFSFEKGQDYAHFFCSVVFNPFIEPHVVEQLGPDIVVLPQCVLTDVRKKKNIGLLPCGSVVEQTKNIYIYIYI